MKWIVRLRNGGWSDIHLKTRASPSSVSNLMHSMTVRLMLGGAYKWNLVSRMIASTGKTGALV
jgi:hypothetical protein